MHGTSRNSTQIVVLGEGGKIRKKVHKAHIHREHFHRSVAEPSHHGKHSSLMQEDGASYYSQVHQHGEHCRATRGGELGLHCWWLLPLP